MVVLFVCYGSRFGELSRSGELSGLHRSSLHQGREEIKRNRNINKTSIFIFIGRPWGISVNIKYNLYLSIYRAMTAHKTQTVRCTFQVEYEPRDAGDFNGKQEERC